MLEGLKVYRVKERSSSPERRSGQTAPCQVSGNHNTLSPLCFLQVLHQKDLGFLYVLCFPHLREARTCGI